MICIKYRSVHMSIPVFLDASELGLDGVFIGSCLITWWCPTLCDPMDCSQPDSSVDGILQARILEWVAISFSRGSS